MVTLERKCTGGSAKNAPSEFILMQVTLPGQRPWLLLVIYGSLTDLSRIAVGDFNSVLTVEEVSNKGKLDIRRCSGFIEWMEEHQLLDLGFSGPNFTWSRGSTPKSFKGARLDRAVCSVDWRIRFEDACVQHLPKVHSDHVPLLITLTGHNNAAPSHLFRFQAACLTHSEFRKEVQTLGKNDKSFLDNNNAIIEGSLNGIRWFSVMFLQKIEGCGRGLQGYRHTWWK